MTKYLLSFFIFLAFGSSCFAQVTACTAKPTITSPTYTYTDTQTLVVTWTTSCGATSTIGFTQGTMDAGQYASSFKQYQDQTYPGVTSHSVTLNNSTGFYPANPGIAGSTGIVIVSCAWTTMNMPDLTQCSTTCNGNSSPCTGTLLAPAPSVVAGTLSYTVSQPPVQDGVHPGYLATPGKDVDLVFGGNTHIIPSSGYDLGNNGKPMVSVSGSLLTDFGIHSGVWSESATQTPWTGSAMQCSNNGGNQYFIYGCALTFVIPSSVPTGSNPAACTSHMGAVVVGTACVFPITVNFSVTGCGTTYATCTNPSYTAWVWVDPETFSFNIGAAGVHRPPCLTDADIQYDPQKTNCTTDISVSQWDLPHSWIGSIEYWGTSHWNYSFKTDAGGQFQWFYDGCQMAVKLAGYTGSTDPWLGYNQTCMHDYRDHIVMPVVLESAVALSFTQATVATLNPNLNGPSGTDICAPSQTSIRCSTMTVPVPASVNLTAICTGYNTSHFSYSATVTGVSGTSTGGSQGHMTGCSPSGTTGGTVTVEAPVTNAPTNGWVTAPAGSAWTFVRQLDNIAADGATDTTHIYCSTCDLTNLGTTDNVCYTGTIYGPNGVNYGSQLWSVNPMPGSLVSAVNKTTKVITLARAIAGLAPGTPFQCRHYTGPPGPTPNIYYWGEEFYDIWQRYGDYTSADLIPRYVTAASGSQAGPTVNDIREQGLLFMDCLENAHLVAASVATAWTNSNCVQGASWWNVLLDHEMYVSDILTRNSLNRAVMTPPNCFVDSTSCDAFGMDTFLGGVRYKALLHCYEDSICPGYQDSRIAWNIQQEMAHFWNDQYSPNSGLPHTFPEYCHQIPYVPQVTALGVSGGSNYYSTKLGHNCYTFNDNQGMLFAGLAWLYYLTGNGTIPGSNPPYTYAQAFDDYFQFEVPQAWYDWSAHPKQQGEQNGLNWEAIEIWFANGTATTSSLPAFAYPILP